MLECRHFVNSDEFAKGLNPFSPASASIKAGRLMMIKTRYLLNKGVDFAIETTLSTRSLKSLLKEAQTHGYQIVVLYFWLSSPDIAIKRVKARVESGGHDIPEEIIVRRYYLGLNYFFNIYSPMADKWILADNSTIPFKIIAQGWKENMVVKDNKKFEFIKEMATNIEKTEKEI